MTRSMEMVKLAFEALDEKKAEDIKVIDISKVSPIADYFMIANGTNERQVQAMADDCLEKLGRAGFTECKVEGYRNAEWILLDFNDIVVHIFNREDRRFFDLERIWRDGVMVDNSVFAPETKEGKID